METIQSIDLEVVIQDSTAENVYDSDEEKDILVNETAVIDCE